jgi:hypothetical protein
MELDNDRNQPQEREYNHLWNDYASMQTIPDGYIHHTPHYQDEPDYTDYAHSDVELCENCDHPFRSTPAGKKFCSCSFRKR